MNGRRRAALVGWAFVAAATFVVLTLLVTRDANAVPDLDRAWHAAVRSFAVDHPRWLSTMRAVTHLGDTVTILVADLALFAACLYQRRRRVAAFVAVVGLGGWGLRLVIRDQVGRPRPGDALWPAESSSFPSGHTTNATLMVALVVVVCWPLIGSAGRRAMVAGAVAYALLVGLSRIVGGVHWPTDVFGGWTLAVGYVCLVAAVFPWSRTPVGAPHESLQTGPPGRPDKV